MIVACALSCVALGIPSSETMTLKHILDGLSENKVRLSDMEVFYRKSVICPKLPRGAKPGNTARRTDLEFRVVWQGSLYYAKFTRSRTAFDGGHRVLPSEYGYDGQYSRLNVQGEMGNIDDRRVEASECVAPYKLAFQQLRVHELHEFLTHNDRIRQDERLNHLSSIRPMMMGSEDVGGHTCMVLHVDVSVQVENQPRSHFRFWVVPALNFSLIRHEHYVVVEGKAKLIQESETSDWREVASGTWIPFGCRTILYDETSNEILTTSTVTVDSVKLNPSYPVEMFQRIEMPKGVPIYTVKNGKIVKREIIQPEDDVTDPATVR